MCSDAPVNVGGGGPAGWNWSRLGIGGQATVRRHPLGVLFAWFFTVGQAIAFVPVVADRVGVELAVWPFIVASTLVGLLLPTIVITWIADGLDGVTPLWRSLTRARIPLRWYAGVLLGIPVLAFAITAVVVGAPPDDSAATFAAAVVFGLPLPLLVTFVATNLWEEVAWMGFVQIRLQQRHGPVRAALVTAPLFAMQHISLAVGSSVVSAVVVMVALTALAVPFRFVTGFVYNRTGSLFLVGLVHAVGDAVTSRGGVDAGLLVRLYPGEGFVSLAHLLSFAVLGLVVVASGRARLGLRAPFELEARIRSGQPAHQRGIALAGASSVRREGTQRRTRHRHRLPTVSPDRKDNSGG